MWQIFESQDGSNSVFSEKYGVSYHSKYGAIQESRHVFIEAGLYAKAIAQKRLSILELGFGTGLNALLTCLEAERLELQVDYTAVELHPLPLEIIAQLNFFEKLPGSPSFFESLHMGEWGMKKPVTPNFTIEKIKGDIRHVELASRYDIIYFDAFSPNVQPDLWGEELMEKCYGLLLPAGVLVTYCAKGSFKRILRKTGFEVETLKGPPGKREMTRALKPVKG